MLQLSKGLSAHDLIGNVIVGVDKRGVEEANEGAKDLVGPEIGHLAWGVDAWGSSHECEIKSDSLRKVSIPVHN